MCNRHSIDQINAAVGAHGAWKMRLRGAIRSGRGDIKSHDASMDNRCEFGQWLYGSQIDATTREGFPTRSFAACMPNSIALPAGFWLTSKPGVWPKRNWQ